MSLDNVSQWLAHATIFGFVLLTIGSLAVWRFPQPVHRVRIIGWTFVACLIVPFIQQFQFVPQHSFGVLNFDTVLQPVADSSSAPRLSFENLDDQNESVPFADNAELIEPFEAEQSGAVVVATETLSPTAAAATTNPSRFSWQLLWHSILVVYFLALAIMLLRWASALARRSAIARRSQKADAHVVDLLRSIAGTSKLPRLLVSDEIASPIMWGVFRCTIVIPRDFVAGNQNQLRWALAHEWAHVLHRDFGTWMLATVTKFVCFFQPQYWWLRRQLMISQDFLADAFAADHGDSAEDYAAFLVSMARQLTGTQPTLSLGIAGPRSSLSRRIEVLVKSKVPLLRVATLRAASAIAVVGLMVGCGLTFVRLGGGEAVAAATTQETSSSQRADENQELPAPITYAGTVIDRVTGEPIVGVKVEVTHQLKHDPKTGQWVTLQTTEHVSGENGKYQFTLPPEEVVEPSLYIMVAAHHPDYQSKGPSGYTHTMIRRNLESGEPPFFETIKLSPGKPVTGVILNPDGTAASDVSILAYSVANYSQSPSDHVGSFQNGTTDEDGRFRLMVASSGDGVLLVYPKNAAAQAIRLHDKRGELETIRLRDGVQISGQVLDANGQPLDDVGVEVRRSGDGGDVDEFIKNSHVGNTIESGAMSNSDGKFTLRPLPPGDYSLRIKDRAHDFADSANKKKRRPPAKTLEHVFLPMKISIIEDEPIEPIEVRAVPHVTVRGRFFDSKGEPSFSYRQFFSGENGGESFFGESTRPGADGWFEFKVARGSTNVAVETLQNEHSGLRWRTSPNEPLRSGDQRNDRIELGTLEDDFTTLEIVQYVSPIVLVKIVDEEGNSVTGFKPNGKYIVDDDPNNRYLDRGTVSRFTHQPDQRWRSNSLLPDVKLKVSIVPIKDGGESLVFDTAPQTILLVEGENKEIVFVMKKRIK